MGDYFGNDYKYFKSHSFSTEARLIIRKKYANKIIRQSLIQTLTEDLSKLNWKQQEEFIKKKNGVKAQYFGSEYNYKQIAEWKTSDFIRKTALYADTIVLEDQVLNQLLNRISDSDPLTVNFVLDYAMEFLSLQENGIFDSNSNNPICLLAPACKWSLAKNGLDLYAWNLTCQTTTEYASSLYDKKFTSIDDLRNYLSQIDDNQFLKIRNDGRLITPEGVEIDSQWLMEERASFGTEQNEDVYEAILHIQKSNQIDSLVYSGLLGTIPITDSKITWDTINWINRIDNKKMAKSLKKATSKDAIILNGIGKIQDDDYKWLGKVPISKLSLLRQRGELIDIRRTLGEGINNIQEASDDEFLDTAKQVYNNIDTAFRKHKTDLERLKDKYESITGIDVFLSVSGSISFGSAIYQSFASAAGILASLPQIATGLTSVALIARDYANRRNDFNALQKKPIAILFEAKEEYQNR